MKTKIIPFDLDIAKKIQAGEVKGRITTKEGKDVRIICTDKALTDECTRTQIVCLIRIGEKEVVSIHDPNTGECWDIEDGKAQHLVLEVPDNEPQFKPFDRVLVRDSNNDEWICAIFSHTRYIQSRLYVRSTNGYNLQCIPYEGNEHLVGTTDKPKED